MYERFSREHDDYYERGGGSGLGLAISKSLVELMGGSIVCQSTKGIGTVFTVALPFDVPAIKKSQNVSAVKTGSCVLNLKNRHVLLCEDNRINAVIIGNLLRTKGVITDYAENGRIGVEKARSGVYDLILMDIRMPVMDGLTAALTIRKFNSTIPIIALSANNYIEDRRKSIKTGMNAHIGKPVNTEELFSVIAHAVL